MLNIILLIFDTSMKEKDSDAIELERQRPYVSTSSYQPTTMTWKYAPKSSSIKLDTLCRRWESIYAPRRQGGERNIWHSMSLENLQKEKEEREDNKNRRPIRPEKKHPAKERPAGLDKHATSARGWESPSDVPCKNRDYWIDWFPPPAYKVLNLLLPEIPFILFVLLFRTLYRILLEIVYYFSSDSLVF